MNGDGINQDDTSEEIYMEYELDAKYRKPKRGLKERLQKQYSCSGERLKSSVYSRFPIVSWLPKYDVKKNLLSDFAAGLTVGVVHIPQGLAYGLLATLPPIVGLYTSLFPVLLYPIFGTSRHVSIGTFAILSILISGVLDQRVRLESDCGEESAVTAAVTTTSFQATYAKYEGNITDTTSHNGSSCLQLYEERKIEVAIGLSVCVGILQILMHIFHLGMVTVFLSESLLGGFLAGSSILVITSQVPKLFGITIDRHSQPLAVVYTYVDIFRNITSTNWVTFALSAGCTIFLVIGKEINCRFKKKLKIPIPWELCIVIISTTASYLGNFDKGHQVVTVGDVPTGIAPSIPHGTDVAALFVDSIPLAVIAFTVEISLCQIFATKHAYQIDSNQELLALGMCNLFGAFFSCYPSASSLSRSIIYEEVGAKTQLGAYFSSAIVLAVLLWIGPLFQPLPQAALAVIIIVNIKNVAMMWKNVKPLWRISRLDALTWIVTWFSVVLFGVSMGLLVGVGFSILTVLFRTRNAFGISLRKVSQKGVYRDSRKYETDATHNNIFVYQFTGPLYFANKDRFVDQLTSRIGFDAAKKSARKKVAATEVQSVKKPDSKDDHMMIPLNENDKIVAPPISNGIKGTRHDHRDSSTNEDQENRKNSSKTFRAGDNYSHVIFDMSQCPFMDSDGSKTILELYDAFSEIGINLMLASCSEEVKRSLRGSWKDREPAVYVSLERAVQFAKNHCSVYVPTSHDGEVASDMHDSVV